MPSRAVTRSWVESGADRAGPVIEDVFVTVQNNGQLLIARCLHVVRCRQPTRSARGSSEYHCSCQKAFVVRRACPRRRPAANQI